MSSIFGIIQFNQKPLATETLQKMQQTLNHWNADDTGIWQNGSVGLGHLMLWNTPESLHEKLPLHHSDSGCTIIADARIDNREELFEKLSIEYSVRKEIPDSTLILKAYEKYEKDCVKHLIGDFAFAIWNDREQQLFCARDQIGVKPFFYYKDENIFAFASEKKGILCLEGINRSINKAFYYNNLFSPNQQAADETFYKYILRLCPANFLKINASSKIIIAKQYWDLDVVTETKFTNENEYYDGLLHHFNHAVQRRIRSVFPLGAELSGGFDSTVVVTAAQHFLKETNKQLITFSNTLPDGISDENLLQLDERKFIDAVIEFNGIEDFVYVTRRIFNNPLEEVDFVLNMNDGLEHWNPQWQLAIKNAAMQKATRTLLTGFGGDELVSYYGHYSFLDFLDSKQYLKYFTTTSNIYDKDFNRLFPFIPNAVMPLLRTLKNILTLNSEKTKKASAIFKIPLRYKIKKFESSWYDKYHMEKFKSFRHFQRERIMKPHTSLRMDNETIQGLYFKTEPRYPMADIQLLQYYISLPNRFKHNNPPRAFFKKTFAPYLPPQIANRGPKEPGSLAPYFGLGNWNDVYKKMFHDLLAKMQCDKKFDVFLNKKKPENASVNLQVLRLLEKGL